MADFQSASIAGAWNQNAGLFTFEAARPRFRITEMTKDVMKLTSLEIWIKNDFDWIGNWILV